MATVSRHPPAALSVMPDYPSLCYAGPRIEPAVGGSALLYKLLKDYPKDKLITVQVSAPEGTPGEASFAGQALWLPRHPRLLGPRGHTIYDLTFLYARQAWATWLLAKMRHLHFDAVVCVVHGWLCEVAREIARRRQVPFHAILHDHADSTLPAPRWLRSYRLQRWRALCRSAHTRLCVSPYMAAEVAELTGCHCQVLYPGLSPDTDLSAWQPPPAKESVTFGYAGALHHGYSDLVLRLGRILDSKDLSLVLHSPQAQELMSRSRAGLRDGGWIPPTEVATTLRHEAQVLFLPMSFAARDRSTMTVGFPSKLVEYCAAGRPMLIWGPPYCSAVRWAKEHPGFALVVETEADEAVSQAVDNLVSEPRRRETMGRQALCLAREFFTHAGTFKVFLEMVKPAPSASGEPRAIPTAASRPTP